MASRNSREGQYMGVGRLGPSKRGKSWMKRKPHHQRKGKELMVLSLKECLRAKVKPVKY